MDKDLISIVWTRDLEVEREEIDDQHRHLFKLLADFYTQLQKGAGRDVLARMLEDLMSYAGEHFAMEEMYLQEHPEVPHGPLRILFTCDEEIGADASDLFNYLTGYSAKKDYSKLLVLAQASALLETRPSTR